MTIATEGTAHIQVASYECDPGYLLSTDLRERVCLEGGVWSGEDPMCERMRTNKLADNYTIIVTFGNSSVDTDGVICHYQY